LWDFEPAPWIALDCLGIGWRVDRIFMDGKRTRLLSFRCGFRRSLLPDVRASSSDIFRGKRPWLSWPWPCG